MKSDSESYAAWTIACRILGHLMKDSSRGSSADSAVTALEDAAVTMDEMAYSLKNSASKACTHLDDCRPVTINSAK